MSGLTIRPRPKDTFSLAGAFKTPKRWFLALSIGYNPRDYLRR